MTRRPKPGPVLGRAPRWACGLALALLPACSAFDACLDRTKTPIVYVDIVDRISAGSGVEVPRARLEAGARRAMDALDDFAFRNAEPDEVSWQLDLDVGLATERTADPVDDAPPDPDRVHRAFAVQLELHAIGETERAPSRVRAEAMLTRDEARSRPFGQLAEDTVAEAGRRLQRATDLYWGPPEAVVPALESEHEWVRMAAADAAGVRKLTSAVGPLMARVRDEDESPDVRIRAVGALVELGDPEAASAIIDACRRKDAQYLVQMVYALGQLGGREAQGYLFTVQSGHPSEAVRAAAGEALEELERRAAARGSDGGAE